LTGKHWTPNPTETCGVQVADSWTRFKADLSEQIAYRQLGWILQAPVVQHALDRSLGKTNHSIRNKSSVTAEYPERFFEAFTADHV